MNRNNMIPRLSNILTLVSLFLLLNSSETVLAQNLFPLEGNIHTYTWNGITEGSNYVFTVVADREDQPGEFQFIGNSSGVVGSDGLASAEIQWNAGSSLNQFEVWLKVSSSGCSNMIFIRISPQPNNRSIGFDAVASNACFLTADNSFELPVSLVANDGEPLSEVHYPVNVTFTVNDMACEQVMEYGSTLLQITETMFSTNHMQDTQVLVEITGATDCHSADIFRDDENSTHTRTIFAIPEIEFTQHLKLLEELNEEIFAHTMHSSVSFDWQEPGSDYTRGE